MRDNHILVTVATGAVACAAATVSSASVRSWADSAGDATSRPSDAGTARSYFDAGLPDILGATLTAWSSPTPDTDPYNGSEVDASVAHLLRLDLIFDGLINPPGTLGLGSTSFQPSAYGQAPVYGFLEIDVDASLDTGGELPNVARLRYLANGGRFGGIPEGSTGQRAALSSFDLDEFFESGPQYERSGAEFAFVLCGCFPVNIVTQDGDSDNIFDSGETWIVQGRFFERFQAMKTWSGVFGGSSDGLYNPQVNVRFAHDAQADTTTVTLVYPLDMLGAGALANAAPQSSDFNVSNQTSVQEALDDIIDTASFIIPDDDVQTLVEGWQGRTAGNYLDPSQWEVTAIFGSTYTDSGAALYVWTDLGFDWTFGDFDADGMANGTDRSALLGEISAKDGGAEDGDGIVNSSVQLVAFADAFSVFDLNYDGYVNQGDIDAFDAAFGIPGDIDGNGVVDGADLAAMLAAWGSSNPSSDINGDGVVDGADLAALLASWT